MRLWRLCEWMDCQVLSWAHPGQDGGGHVNCRNRQEAWHGVAIPYLLVVKIQPVQLLITPSFSTITLQVEALMHSRGFAANESLDVEWIGSKPTTTNLPEISRCHDNAPLSRKSNTENGASYIVVFHMSTFPTWAYPGMMKNVRKLERIGHEALAKMSS